MQLSHDEAQRLIYKGCARLAQAMKVAHVAPDAAQKWEDGALREARIVLAAAVNGPLTDLVIPPLPLALIEVHKSLAKLRPMRPSDVHAPFEQASTSPWSVWMADEADIKIPSEVDLGEPSTFWWTGLREKRTRKTLGDFVIPPLPANPPTSLVPVPHALSDRRVQVTQLVNKPTAVVADGSESAGFLAKVLPAEMDRQSASEPDTVTDNGGRLSKRCHTDQSSDGEDEPGDRYIYVQKCDRCKDRGLVCRVAQVQRDKQPACTPCKAQKHRCSAIQGQNRVIKQSDVSKPRPTERSIIDMFRSRETGPAASPPSKRPRVFVHIPVSTSKAPSVHATETQADEPPKVGPPGGKWMWQKRAERGASPLPGDTTNSSVSPSRSMTPTPPPTNRTSPGSSVTVTATPTSTPAPGTETSAGRVLVDKCVGTEGLPQDQEFLKLLMSMMQDYVSMRQ